MTSRRFAATVGLLFALIFPAIHFYGLAAGCYVAVTWLIGATFGWFDTGRTR